MSKVRILVVADDITGAAEVAGVAHEAGCRVRFTTSWEGLTEGEVSEVTVLATDTRSMPQSEARQCAQAVVDTLRQGENPYTHLFKKTDSVLRGWVADELAPFAELGYDKVLLMPANPSKGRTIEQGEYRINGTPLHETVFSTDPEFPARTSNHPGARNLDWRGGHDGRLCPLYGPLWRRQDPAGRGCRPFSGTAPSPRIWGSGHQALCRLRQPPHPHCVGKYGASRPH